MCINTFIFATLVDKMYADMNYTFWHSYSQVAPSCTQIIYILRFIEKFVCLFFKAAKTHPSKGCFKIVTWIYNM